MNRNRKFEDDILPTNIKFGLGISPFGGMVISGTQNWFDLLVSVTKQEKCLRKHSRRRERQDTLYRKSKSVMDIPQITPKKEDILRRPKAYSLPPRLLEKRHRPRIPKITITKASRENLFDLRSSDDDDDDDDENNIDDSDCVYECPGLAARDQDMTVENPLFTEKVSKSSYRTPELPRRFWKDVFTETV